MAHMGVHGPAGMWLLRAHAEAQPGRTLRDLATTQVLKGSDVGVPKNQGPFFDSIHRALNKRAPTERIPNLQRQPVCRGPQDNINSRILHSGCKAQGRGDFRNHSL